MQSCVWYGLGRIQEFQKGGGGGGGGGGGEILAQHRVGAPKSVYVSPIEELCTMYRIGSIKQEKFIEILKNRSLDHYH